MFNEFKLKASRVSRIVKYISRAVKTFQNYFLFFGDYLSLLKNPYLIKLKDGTNLLIRPRCDMEIGDIDILEEILFEDIYRINENVLEDDVVVDVGAHIGIFALLAAKKAKKGRVLAFEPVNESFDLLQGNIRLNNLNNLKAYQYAVCDKRGFIDLYLSQKNIGANTVFPSLEISKANLTRVECINLEYIFESFGIERINLLKIDCEGCEYPILLNSNGVLLEKIDRIIFEEHITDSISAIYPDKVLENHLINCQFEVSILKEIFYEGEGFFRIIYACHKSSE